MEFHHPLKTNTRRSKSRVHARRERNACEIKPSMRTPPNEDQLGRFSTSKVSPCAVTSPSESGRGESKKVFLRLVSGNVPTGQIARAREECDLLQTGAAVWSEKHETRVDEEIQIAALPDSSASPEVVVAPEVECDFNPICRRALAGNAHRARRCGEAKERAARGDSRVLRGTAPGGWYRRSRSPAHP